MFGMNFMAWNGRDLEKLEVLQNRVGRLALGAPKWMAAEALREDLGWSLFSERMVKAVLNYKIAKFSELINYCKVKMKVFKCYSTIAHSTIDHKSLGPVPVYCFKVGGSLNRKRELDRHSPELILISCNGLQGSLNRVEQFLDSSGKMVRVICVHHFTQQDVAVLADRGECHGCCAGPGDWLLVAGEHRVNMRDLQKGAKSVGSFSTVDVVQQIVYCQYGNFVATLESKTSRPDTPELTYVRVYVNWDQQTSPRPSVALMQSIISRKEAEVHGGSMIGGDDNGAPPMRARIAGRVTPSGNTVSRDSLEMIEIPLTKPASYVNVCEATGNIIVACDKSLAIFKFERKFLDVPRVEYIDFEEIMEIDVGSKVREASLLEDLVGYVADGEAHVFQIVTNQIPNGKGHYSDPTSPLSTFSILAETGSWDEGGTSDVRDGTTRLIYTSRSHSRSHSRSPSIPRSSRRSPKRSPTPSSRLRGKAKEASREGSPLHSRVHHYTAGSTTTQQGSPLHSRVYHYTAGYTTTQQSTPLHNKVHSPLHSRVHSPLHSRVHSPLHSRVHSPLHSRVHSPLHSSVYHYTAETQQGSPLHMSRLTLAGCERPDRALRLMYVLLLQRSESKGRGGTHNVYRAAGHIDLSKAQLSSMVPYGTPRIVGGLSQSLGGNTRLLLLPSVLQSALGPTAAQEALSCRDPSLGEFLGPSESSPGSPVRIRVVSSSGQRLIAGLCYAVSLVHRCFPTRPSTDGGVLRAPSHRPTDTLVPFFNIRLIPMQPGTAAGISFSRSSHPLFPSSPMSGATRSCPSGGALFGVFFSTPQCGYLYHLTLKPDPYVMTGSSVQRGCVFTYTSAAATVVLEQSLVHALTLTGLETYTLPPHPGVLRAVLPEGVQIKVLGQWANGGGESGSLPTPSNGGSGQSGGLGGCLVGLRPFLNVHSLTLTASCLALIASPGDAPRGSKSRGSTEDTLYSLHRPSPGSLFQEMLRVGRTHYPSAPSTYLHLLMEGIMVLATHHFTVSSPTAPHSGRGQTPEDHKGSESARSDGSATSGHSSDSSTGTGVFSSGASSSVAAGTGIEECMKLKMAGKKLEEMESSLAVLRSPRNIAKTKQQDSAAPSMEQRPDRTNMARRREHQSPPRRKSRTSSGRRSASTDKKVVVLYRCGDVEDPWTLLKEAMLLLADYHAVHSSEQEWLWSCVRVYLGFAVSPTTVIARLTAAGDSLGSSTSTDRGAGADAHKAAKSAASAGNSAENNTKSSPIGGKNTGVGNSASRTGTPKLSSTISRTPASSNASGKAISGATRRGSTVSRSSHGKLVGPPSGTTSPSGSSRSPSGGSAASKSAGGSSTATSVVDATSGVGNVATSTAPKEPSSSRGSSALPSLAENTATVSSSSERACDALVFTLCNMLTDPAAPVLSCSEATAVLECLERLSPDRVSRLLLSSVVVRDYKTDKVMSLLKRKLARHSPPRPYDVLAVAAVVVQRGTPEQVASVLGLLRPHELLHALQQYPSLLLQHTPPALDGDSPRCSSTTARHASSAPPTPRTPPQYTLTPLALVLLDHKWDVFCALFMSVIGDSSSCSGYVNSATVSDATSSSRPSLTLDGFVTSLMDARPIVTCGPECNVNSLRLRDFLEAYFMEHADTIARGVTSVVDDGARPYSRSVSVLVSLYLASLLGAFTPQVSLRLSQPSLGSWTVLGSVQFGSRDAAVREEQRQCLVEVYGPRPAYLNFLCSSEDSFTPSGAPFPNYGSKVEASSAASLPNHGARTELQLSDSDTSAPRHRKPRTDLLILQSLLCSPLPSQSDRNHVAKFIASNTSIAGSESILAACLTAPGSDRLNTQQLQLMLDRHQRAVLAYTRETCKTTDQWREVVSHIMHVDEPTGQYSQILREILVSLSESMSFRDFVSVLPSDSSSTRGVQDSSLALTLQSPDCSSTSEKSFAWRLRNVLDAADGTKVAESQARVGTESQVNQSYVSQSATTQFSASQSLKKQPSVNKESIPSMTAANSSATGTANGGDDRCNLSSNYGSKCSVDSSFYVELVKKCHARARTEHVNNTLITYAEAVLAKM
ncbi:Hermansky-Pudlak syndrome 3 central region [Trinorchestia longiramus]|nr:Hermansky-Pudlak syndrome 3 central region [Trinorchestia longiramus]